MSERSPWFDFAAALLLCVHASSAWSMPVSGEWIEKWRVDLGVVRDALPEIHPDPFHNVSRDEFERELDALADRVPTLEHSEIVVELTRIVARIGDGHTRLTLPLGPGIEGFFQGHSTTSPPMLTELQFHQYPVRFALCPDGLFVDQVAEEFAWARGARVVQIGSLATEDALSAVAPLIRRDNEMGVRELQPMFLAIPEILAARGVSPDGDRVALRLAAREPGASPPQAIPAPASGGVEVPIDPRGVPFGEEILLDLHAVPFGEEVVWAKAPANYRSPLSSQHLDGHFWLDSLESDRLVYLQLVEIGGDEEETTTELASRLESLLRESSADKLVLDLRDCWGGDGTMFRPLLHAILRSDQVNRIGHLFTLIDGTTFSAGGMAAVDLERHTQTLFVGAPTGASPNGYGDSRKVRLPNTGLTLRISTLYWQYSDPRDFRPWIAPDIGIEASSEDDRAGRDPALEFIAALRPSLDGANLAGSWSGRLRNGFERLDARVRMESSEVGWSAWVSMPAGELVDEPVEGLRIDLPDLRFTLLLGGETMAFSGTLYREWIFGTASYAGLTLPFALRRED